MFVGLRGVPGAAGDVQGQFGSALLSGNLQVQSMDGSVSYPLQMTS